MISEVRLSDEIGGGFETLKKQNFIITIRYEILTFLLVSMTKSVSQSNLVSQSDLENQSDLDSQLDWDSQSDFFNQADFVS